MLKVKGVRNMVPCGTDETIGRLVAGYSPLAVNNWTLNSFANGIAVDGSYYYLLDTQDLRIFADHTVYLAFYKGFAPSSEVFSVAEDGSISFAEDFDGAQALFTLPLDASLADPAAADAFVESTGMNIWSDESAEEAEDGSYITVTEMQETDGTDDTAKYGSYVMTEDGVTAGNNP